MWCGEVGQNLFEEIFLIEKGGNYGWNIRERFHPFGNEGVGPRPDIIEPIWEYHHDIGKSITGGGVYRGKEFPELVGRYLYGDYTSSRLWALKYDEQQKRVVANRPLADHLQPTDRVVRRRRERRDVLPRRPVADRSGNLPAGTVCREAVRTAATLSCR